MPAEIYRESHFLTRSDIGQGYFPMRMTDEFNMKLLAFDSRGRKSAFKVSRKV